MKLYIGENIRRCRQEKGMTQEMLAETLGVSFQAISRWETGAAYPDIEMLPRIARFFSVSMDQLMGTDRISMDEKKNEYRQRLQSLKTEGKYDEALLLWREMIYEYPRDWDVLIQFCSFLQMRIRMGSKELLTELRRFCSKIWEECSDHSIQMRAIKIMVCTEESEVQVEEWIRKSQFGKTAYELRLARCEFRGEAEEREKIKEQMNLDAIRNICFNMRFWHGEPSQSVEGNRIALKLLDVVSEKNESEAFLWDYAFFNTRLCAGLFASGKIEEGYQVMEKVVEMLERWFSIPDGTEILYRCHCFRNLTYKKIPRRFDFFERPHGWEWFDCVRGEERYQALAARVAECNRKLLS